MTHRAGDWQARVVGMVDEAVSEREQGSFNAFTQTVARRQRPSLPPASRQRSRTQSVGGVPGLPNRLLYRTRRSAEKLAMSSPSKIWRRFASR